MCNDRGGAREPVRPLPRCGMTPDDPRAVYVVEYGEAMRYGLQREHTDPKTGKAICCCDCHNWDDSECADCRMPWEVCKES